MAVLQGGAVVAVEDMPAVKVSTRNQLDAAELARLVREMKPDLAIIERVGSMPGQGVASTFAFGMATGVAHGVFAALGVPVELVTPQVWKRSLSVPKEKDASRLVASRLYPASTALWQRKKDHNRADAVLIATWAVRRS